jgi:hypothetical protein
MHICRLVVRLQAANTIGKCILCGENTLHWTTEYCFVQSDWQCTLTTNLQITIVVFVCTKSELSS